MKLHEGKTLRGVLTDAVRQKKVASGRLSVAYLRGLKQAYGGDDEMASKRLLVTNQGEEVRASLLEAVRKASCIYSASRSSGSTHSLRLAGSGSQ